MKKISGLILFSMAALFLAGCDDTNASIEPAMIANLKAEPQEGAILLRWDNPSTGDYLYTQLQYVDPLTGKLQKINVSHFTDQYTLTGLFRKNGEYRFKAYAVSSTGTFSTTWEEASATALKVPPTVTPTAPVPVALTAEMLSSNASDPTEGQLAHLVDGNPATFWHSNWHQTIPFPNHIQIDLQEEVQGVRIRITNRDRVGYTPGEVDILGSNDGVEWTTLGSLATGTIPDVVSGVYETPLLSVYPETGRTFSKIRFNVKNVVGGNPFWCLSELELSKVSYQIIDPEA